MVTVLATVSLETDMSDPADFSIDMYEIDATLDELHAIAARYNALTFRIADWDSARHSYILAGE